ncbi:hypothetical protein HPB50_012498 [Hyalomma asiaticum]|uniref:Uncharacterized protein n=1 Tax=Hyalomma asiaticum TaxID=266040 RepID=A0ACB7SGE6_HYAAI|nr:hypothetical protein HPB50_012498 [Hyalomma asiaticum]
MKSNFVTFVLLVGLAITHCKEIKYEDCDQDSDTATLDAEIKVLGIMVPIPGVEKDLCKAVIQCPVVKGSVYHATMYAHVSSWSPPIETTVQIKITGDEGLSVCIRSKIVIA